MEHAHDRQPFHNLWTEAGRKDAFRHISEHYRQEDKRHQIEADSAEKHTELAKGFHKYGVNYIDEIRPLFERVRNEFMMWLINFKAQREVGKEYRKRYRLSQSVLRHLTTQVSLFSDEIMAQLDREFADLPPPEKIDWTDGFFLPLGDSRRSHVLDRNLDKSPHKHPIWTQLAVQLYDVLHDEYRTPRISETRTFKLIANLYRALVPGCEEVAKLEDGIRLKVKQYKKTER